MTRGLHDIVKLRGRVKSDKCLINGCESLINTLALPDLLATENKIPK